LFVGPSSVGVDDVLSIVGFCVILMID